MTEETLEYRLVFSGEVAEGQHPAVVKKRLATVLKLDDERMDILFAGKPVVVKKATDGKTAARYQDAFQKAGARLRVLPVEDAAAAPAAEPDPAPEQPASSPQASPPPQAGELEAMPVGSDLLAEGERAQVESQDIDTDHLSVQGAVFTTDEPEEAVDSPNVDHISLAELGSMLGNPADEMLVEEIDVSFDLAEVGALLKEADAAVQADPDLADVNFEVAEVGADMGVQDKTPPPPAPDTSHIELEDDNK